MMMMIILPTLLQPGSIGILPTAQSSSQLSSSSTTTPKVYGIIVVVVTLFTTTTTTTNDGVGSSMVVVPLLHSIHYPAPRGVVCPTALPRCRCRRPRVGRHQDCSIGEWIRMRRGRHRRPGNGTGDGRSDIGSNVVVR